MMGFLFTCSFTITGGGESGGGVTGGVIKSSVSISGMLSLKSTNWSKIRDCFSSVSGIFQMSLSFRESGGGDGVSTFLITWKQIHIFDQNGEHWFYENTII